MMSEISGRGGGHHWLFCASVTKGLITSFYSFDFLPRSKKEEKDVNEPLVLQMRCSGP